MVAIEPEARRDAPAPAADAIPAAARRRATSPGRVFAACALGAAVLAVLAAPDLPDWADRLRDTPGTAELRAAANGWAEAVAQLGLGAPHRELRREMQHWLDAEWP